MRQLLPVAVAGLQESRGLPELASHYHQPMPAAPMVRLQARLTAGEALVGAPQAPILAQRRWGQGRVVFLAVDYAAQPLDTWTGQKALWNDILQPSEQVDYSRVFAELGLLDDAHPMVKLLSRPILNYPSHTLLSLALIAYCGVLALIFWWMRRRGGWGRGGWAVAATVALAAVGAYLFCQERGLREAALLYDLSVMEVFYQDQQPLANDPKADPPYARAQGYLGVFSPRGGNLSLTFQNPDAILRHTFYRGMGQGDERLNLRLEAETKLDGVRLEPWSLRVMSVDSMTPSPLRAQAERHATGLTIRVQNRGAITLQDAAVLYLGRLFDLGPIAPGQEVFEDLYVSLQSAESQYETAWQALHKGRGSRADKSARYLREVLLQRYFGETHLSQVSQTPLLIGWLPAPATLAPSAGAPTIHGMTLVVGHLTPQPL